MIALDNFTVSLVSTVFSGLIGLTGLLLPHFTNMTNSRKETENKKLELYCSQKLDAYRKLAESYGRLSASQSDEDLSDCISAINCASLVSDKETRELLRYFAKILTESNGVVSYETDELFGECLDTFSDEYHREMNSYISRPKKSDKPSGDKK